MKWRELSIVVSLAIASVFLVAACSSPFVVTQPLEQPLPSGISCSIDAIDYRVPAETDDEGPDWNKIRKLQDELQKSLEKKELFDRVEPLAPEASYHVSGSVLAFKGGSGTLRFLFGALAGSAHMTVELSLTERGTNRVIFAGNFKRSVTSWAEGSDAMLKRIADDFADELEKQMSDLTKP